MSNAKWAAAQEVPAAEESDASVRCYGTNGWQSQWLWAEALHHSSCPKVMERAQHVALRGQETGTRAGEGEVHEKYDAPRRQNAPHPGERPGCLVDPGPQRRDRTVRRSAGDSLPTAGLPVLAGASGKAVDSSALSFLVQLAVKDRKREEEEKQAVKEKEKAEKELQQARRLRKAMREAGFSHYPWLPSDDGTHWHNTETNETRPYPPSSSSGQKRKRKKRRKKRLPRGRARRRQRQRPLSGALIVDSGRGMCRACFPSSRCVPFGCRQAQMLGIMAGITRRTRTPLVSGSHLFAVLLGSTVDTCCVSLQRLLWVELFELSAMLGSTVALGDDFRIVSVFIAELGSTVDTCRHQSTRRLEEFHTFST